MDYGRLILDPPLPGPVNMARDEAMLEGCREAANSPTLRLYAWHAPTISLGYFQDYAEYEALDGDLAGLDVVRRTTGGGAILHDLEVTYSLVIPAAHPLVAGRPNRLYELAHRAIIATIGCGVRLDTMRRRQSARSLLLLCAAARPGCSGGGRTRRDRQDRRVRAAPHGIGHLAAWIDHAGFALQSAPRDNLVAAFRPAHV